MFLLIGFLLGEILCGLETYNAFNCDKIVFRHWKDQVYYLNEYFDCVYYSLFGIGATLCTRLLFSDFWLGKQVSIFMCECFLIDLGYCTFVNPFIYHADKLIMVGFSLLFYGFQYFLYRTFGNYEKSVSAIFIFLITKIEKLRKK